MQKLKATSRARPKTDNNNAQWPSQVNKDNTLHNTHSPKHAHMLKVAQHWTLWHEPVKDGNAPACTTHMPSSNLTPPPFPVNNTNMYQHAHTHGNTHWQCLIHISHIRTCSTSARRLGIPVYVMGIVEIEAVVIIHARSRRILHIFVYSTSARRLYVMGIVDTEAVIIIYVRYRRIPRPQDDYTSWVL